MDEAVLRRPYGGAAVMRAQLRRLVEAAALPHVTLQVVPFARGGHAGASGSFSVLRFQERDLPDVVYIEQLTSALYLDQRPDVEHYLEVVDQLSGEALTPAETAALHRAGRPGDMTGTQERQHMTSDEAAAPAGGTGRQGRAAGVRHQRGEPGPDLRLPARRQGQLRRRPGSRRRGAQGRPGDGLHRPGEPGVPRPRRPLPRRRGRDPAVPRHRHRHPDGGQHPPGRPGRSRRSPGSSTSTTTRSCSPTPARC